MKDIEERLIFMDIYDIGPKGGSFWSGIFIRAMDNADCEVWRLFWSNIPEEYHKIYIEGYSTYTMKESDMAWGVFVPEFVALCIYFYYIVQLVFCYDFFPVVVVAVLLTVALYSTFYWKYREERNITTHPEPVGEAEMFFVVMRNEYNKFHDEVWGKLYDKEIKSELFDLAEKTVLLGTAITGHLGVGLATLKVMEGEELTPLNVVSAAVGIDGLSGGEDFIDEGICEVDNDVSIMSEDSIADVSDNIVDNNNIVDGLPNESISALGTDILENGVENALDPDRLLNIDDFYIEEGGNRYDVFNQNGLNVISVHEVSNDKFVIQDNMSFTIGSIKENPFTGYTTISLNDGNITTITDDGSILDSMNIHDGRIITLDTGEMIVKDSEDITQYKITPSGVILDPFGMQLGKIG